MIERCVVLGLLASSALSVALAGNSSSDGGWVVLRVEDYRDLMEKAVTLEPKPAPPPVHATLTQLDYDLRISADAAHGTARLVVDVLNDGWVRVAIPRDFQVRATRIDGNPGSVVGAASEKGEGLMYLVFSRRGRAIADLDIVIPVASSAGSDSITIPPSMAALTTTTVTMPRRGVEMTASQGLIDKVMETASESRFVAHGRSSVPLVLSWRRRLEDRVAQPLRLRGSINEFVGLGEDGSQVSADVDIEVVQGILKQTVLGIADGLVVNQVSGAAVSDWDYRPGSLSVTLLEPVETGTKLVVSGEAHTPRDSWVQVPLVRLRDAERETGGVAVDVIGAGEIKGRQVRGLDETDPSGLGESVVSRGSPSIAAFVFRPQDGTAQRSLSVEVARYTPESVVVANVEEARYEAIVGEEGKVLVRGRFAVRNNQRSFLAMRLPPGAVLWSAAVSGLPLRPGRSDDGALLLPLEKGRSGEEAPCFDVEAVYAQKGPAWQHDGSWHLALPSLDLEISRIGLVLYHSPRYRIEFLPGVFREEEYSDPYSEILARDSPIATPSTSPPPAAAPSEEDRSAEVEVENLVALYKREGHGGRAGSTLPIRVRFFGVGESRYLVSELTAENTSPAIDLRYKQTTKGAWK
ncbi:MAG: hypothetical protein AB1714_09245 [Acidobacteriota bacterium]